MKRAIAPTTLAVVFTTVFALGIVPGAQAGEDQECSNATLRGSFGFTSTGMLLAIPPPSAGPFAEIGRQTFDGKGDNTEGTATLSANGNIGHVTFFGTYVVNPDCTGSMTLFVSNGRTITLDFVIDDDGAELRALLTSTPSGNTESRAYRKQSSRGRKDQ